jgi:hypothetical protein
MGVWRNTKPLHTSPRAHNALYPPSSILGRQVQQLIAAKRRGDDDLSSPSKRQKQKEAEARRAAAANGDKGKGGKGRGKGGKGSKADRDNDADDEPWAVREGNRLTIGHGAVTINLEPAAKAMKVEIEDLCWGIAATSQTPTVDFWKHMCLGGSGHERFDTACHKASMAARPGVRKLLQDPDIMEYRQKRDFR